MNDSSAIVYCTCTERAGVIGILAVNEKNIIGSTILHPQRIYGLEKLESEEECLICYDKLKNVLLKPCCHICSCDECASSLLSSKCSCPICRKRIFSVFMFSDN